MLPAVLFCYFGLEVWGWEGTSVEERKEQKYRSAPPLPVLLVNTKKQRDCKLICDL